MRIEKPPRDERLSRKKITVLANDGPGAAAIVTVATARFAPPVALAPLPPPVVGVDAQSEIWSIVGASPDAPAIAFVITDHCG